MLIKSLLVNKFFDGFMGQIKAVSSCLVPPRAVSVGLDALLFLGLIGIYYPGWGRVMAWLSFAVALSRYAELEINHIFHRNVLMLLGSLALISMQSAYPYNSICAVADIGLGFCMFLPGVLFGRQLLERPYQTVPLLLACLLTLIHLLFPVTVFEHLSYGFFDNPNLNGRGLSFVGLLLGILFWSFLKSPLLEKLPRSQLFHRFLLIAFANAGICILLVLTNYRAGWLAIASFFILSCSLLFRAAPFLRLAVSTSVCACLVVLVSLFDVKGFGYGSVGERLLMWNCSLESWVHKYFWFGAGFDSFKRLRLQCMPNSAIGLHAYPHNVTIELLLSVGIVGSLCVLVFVLIQLRSLILSGCFRSPVAIAAFSAVIGLFVSSQLDMKFASFTYVGSVSALVGIIYSQHLGSHPVEDDV